MWRKLSEKDAAREDATDLFITGTRLALGQNGDPRDVKFAMDLYKKAAELNTPVAGGHPAAMLHLGIHHERGIGVPQDYSQAFHWKKRVANHSGHAGEENMHPALLALGSFLQGRSRRGAVVRTGH